MGQTWQTRASPEAGCSIAFKVMDDAVSFHLATADADTASREIRELAEKMFFYRDIDEAYNAAMARINEARAAERQRLEERRQQQQRDMMMSIVSIMKDDRDEAVRPPDRSVAVAEPSELPEQLKTQKARAMWQRLQQKGYVDDHCQPTMLSRTQTALLASEMAERLEISQKWKTFERLWGRKDMRADYNKALCQRKTLDFMGELKTLFADIQ